ncbi:MAG: hypothetical protein HYX87_09210 [Chloroflexi bacterium]|nr:hypothetical protein [Chloroflexota bacterium]
MKKLVRITAVSVLVISILLAGLGARPASNTFGLGKGNKTNEVPANVWNGTYFPNTAGTGRITRVELLVDDNTPSGVVRMGVYAATPVTLMQDLGYAPVVNGWVSIEGLNIPVTAGTYYYLAFNLQNPNRIRFRTKQEPNSQYSAPYPYDAPLVISDQSSDMPKNGVLSSGPYVMRATVSR